MNIETILIHLRTSFKIIKLPYPTFLRNIIKKSWSNLDNRRSTHNKLQCGISWIYTTDTHNGESPQLVGDRRYSAQPHRTSRVTRYTAICRVLFATYIIIIIRNTLCCTPWRNLTKKWYIQRKKFKDGFIAKRDFSQTTLGYL